MLLHVTLKELMKMWRFKNENLTLVYLISLFCKFYPINHVMDWTYFEFGLAHFDCRDFIIIDIKIIKFEWNEEPAV